MTGTTIFSARRSSREYAKTDIGVAVAYQVSKKFFEKNAVKNSALSKFIVADHGRER